jgi:hypothetical protein
VLTLNVDHEQDPTARHRGEAVKWDEESLECGYVLARPPEGGWWHLHFGRSDMSYHCELLGRRTDILACIQWFIAGAIAKSPQFILTLDGEGVELAPNEPRLDFASGQGTTASEVLADAHYFQREVMPLLYDSPPFQRAAAEVVRCQQHLRVVTLGQLVQREPGGTADRPRD